MSELSPGPAPAAPRRRIPRTAAVVVAPALIAGALAVTAGPSAYAADPTPAAGVVTTWGSVLTGSIVPPAGAQSDVKAVAAGSTYALALKSTGSVIAWGDSSMGATSVPAAAQSGVTAIDAMDGHALALKTDGTMVSWGELSVPTTSIPGATQVAAMNHAALALKSDGTITAWGTQNDAGQRNVPASVQGHAVGIAAGNALGVALTDTGSVVEWGSDGVSSGAPVVPDAANSGVKKVVTGNNGQVAAIKTDGSVVTWGRSLGGTPDAAMSGVVDVAIGYDFAVAVKSDGTVVHWGPGTSPGQQNIPAAVGYRTTSLAAGAYFGVAVHQPWSAPGISGTAPNGYLTAPYSFTPTLTGTPTPTVTRTAGTLPPGLSLDASGKITGTPTVAGTYSFTLTAANGAGTAAAADQTITVGQGTAPSLSGTPAGGYVGVPYTFTPTTIGTPTPTLSVASGVLPPGLKITTDGKIAGTPQTAATYILQLKAANGIGTPVSMWSTIVISPSQAPTISGTAGDAVVGQPYTFAPVVSGTPAPTVTRTAGSLPPGLSLDPSGRITGTPGTPGTYSFTLTAANGMATPATLRTSITVSTPSAPAISGTPAAGYSGLHYTFTPTVTGTPKPTLTVTAGTLPPGLQITSGGQIDGLPYTSGTYAFTLTAANDVGTPATLATSITISPSHYPYIVGTAGPGYTGRSYSFTPTVTGTPTPTVTRTAGALPPGLSLDPSGKITGTPTATGTYAFSLTAANGVWPDNSTGNFAITVYQSQAPAISGTPPMALTSNAYVFTPTITGTPAPSLTVSAGALPPGLGIDSLNRISGTPTAPGVYDFTLTAANGVGSPASLSTTITVHTLPSVSGTPTPAVLGKAYDYALTIGGDPAPTSVQVTAGTLPEGLSLTAAGHITGTPTKAGRATVTIKATSAVASTSVPVTVTVQPARSANFQFIDPPASVATGALESDDYVRTFAERYNQTLTSDLTVGGDTIPAGTRVNVYYVHADHVGSHNLATKFDGSEWFGTKVLATATTTADLQATTPLLGAAGTTYPTSTDQGLEYDDSATRWIDKTGVDVSLNSWSASDAIRIITLAP
jgi:hypothetical protein